MATLLKVPNTEVGPSAPVRIESLVDDRFAGLRWLVSAPKGRTQLPLDDAMALFDELHRWLLALQSARTADQAPARVDLLSLRAQADRLPEPLRSMFNDLAARSESLTGVARKRK
jgi:type VI secretion system protein ImpL